ncbi:hypothetical protein PISL3812_07594 [Talaromyces islandicus]|uniref:DUF7582 domain-containing protein n=1 Tax=Talaromyces islandicus TaxID=28573 RepID=A0A0U1M688_TALIS|nr:hypothetical protein PISL3812_07594 [Talaromyces islandicus]
MVGIRLPLSIGTGPSSPRTITSDMISPPLSPDFNFDSDALTSSTLPALEYISHKLQQKSLHVTLLVGRGQPMPTGQAADLVVIPVTELDIASWKIFYRIVEKGARKFSLGQSWTDALSQHIAMRIKNEYLVEQSLRQNEILFSQEGLTVLNVDRIYTLKRRLCVLAASQELCKKNPAHEEKYISSCVSLLHKTITNCQGRPFSPAFFHRIYQNLPVSDELLKKVSIAYKERFNQEGIVMPKPKSKPAAPTPARREIASRTPPVMRAGPRVRRPGTNQSRPIMMHSHSRAPSRAATPKRGPKTPVSASDVTPITRNEWNILMGPEFHQNKPMVTMWVPSPVTVPVVG